jgi:TRAP-type C4-dicarboxylate transport system permease large subunit
MKTKIAYVFVAGNAPGTRIGLVNFMESGYYATDYDLPSMEEADAKELVALLNARLEVPEAVSTAMLYGSMFGWMVPAARAAMAHFGVD